MSPFSADPITQLAFSIYENKRVFALLLGSGLSRAAEIPTGWEITLDLIRRIGLAQGVTEQADWAQWYTKTTGQEPDYSELLKQLGASQHERRAILHSYIEPSEEDRQEGRKLPTVAHEAIADLVKGGFVRVILTTNFDRLLETALRERGIEPTVIATVDAMRGAEPFAHSDCYIVKLHGDYKDARILNTNDELSTYPKEYRALLDRIFDEHGLIIAGWSGAWDHALRASIMRSPNRRYSTYWVTRSALGAPAKELVTHLRAKTIQAANADEFFKSLQQRVETLEATHRQNPQSTELLTASVKRYLAKPEYRIQLEELFSEEAKRLLTQIDDERFGGQGAWGQIEFRRRVAQYEAITEPLARMAGILGRWGEEKHFHIVLDVIRAVSAHAEKVGGGLTVWLSIRTYPAVLIFTAYGLGLVRSEHWKTLYSLLNAEIPRPYNDPRKIADSLFLGAWKGTDQDVWKQLEGLHDRKTPLSDHLVEILKPWADSFVGLAPDFETLFEKFELLCSLANFTIRHEKDFRLPPHSDFSWMPMGRTGWHESVFAKNIKEIGEDPLAGQLLSAGFAHRDKDFMDQFVTNAKRMASRMRW